MLLQPFAENAVKHAIPVANSDAAITINFYKTQKDIELCISDNGKGFDIAKQTGGLGLQLSKKRIALLNTIYKESPISLDVQSGKNGTTVRILLKHWL